MKIYAQLQKARASFPPIDLDGSVNYATTRGVKAFKYATLPNIVNKITPILLENDIYFSQLIQSDGVRLMIYNTTGDIIETVTPIIFSSGSPQDWGSAISYTKRYQLSAALGLVTEEDDDGQKASSAKPAKVSANPTIAVGSKLFRSIKKKIDDGEDITKDLIKQHYEVSDDVLLELFPPKS